MITFSESNFDAVYICDADKVTISYEEKIVMSVNEVSNNYNIKNLNYKEIAALVFNDVKKIASDIVKDDLEIR